MRVLVTGSRGWPDPNTVWIALDAALAGTSPVHQFVVVHGGCPTGADLEAGRWAKARAAETGRRIGVEVHRASWREHGRAAGPLRNTSMVRAGADVCLAFVHCGSAGASHCARLAQRAGIHTVIHRSAG